MIVPGRPQRLADVASVIRSKNAGPFSVTLDVMFDSPELLDRVVTAGVLTPEVVGPRYGVAPELVRVVVFPPAHAVKIAMPRRASSGSPEDTDVYGTQQHTPLFDLEIPDQPVRGAPA